MPCEQVKICCPKATPADNIAPAGENAQKVGRCLCFLLHALGVTFQIVSRNLVAVDCRLSQDAEIGLLFKM
jgi:hypothetical protein